jgi:tocopherol cyclase
MAMAKPRFVIAAWLVAVLYMNLCLALSLPKLPPHAGYHGAAANPRKPFFEGWYLRVVTPQKDSIALIFHVFDPHTTLPTQRQGVGIQVITPMGSTFVESQDVSTFRADSHDLEIRNFFSTGDFFRLTGNRASGRASSSGKKGAISAEFDFDIMPQIGWGGGADSKQFSTAGWLAAFPVFEPHYQVIMSKGLAMGSISIRDDEGVNYNLNLDGSSVYLEKNWGGSFPSSWWWIQANTFQNGSDLCVTSTGAKRRLPLLDEEEEVALVGIHWNGLFLPFPTVNWKVRWGEWQVVGSHGEYRVELLGSCDGIGVPVRCPTSSGMEEIALETFRGDLRVKLYKNDHMVLDETTSEACLEVGGLPWSRKVWIGESAMKEPIKSVVMNENMERTISDVLQLVNAFVDIPGL